MITLNKREKTIAVICVLFCLAFIGKQFVYARFVDYRDGLDNRMELVVRKIAQAKGVVHQETGYDTRLKDIERSVGLVSSEGDEMTRMASKAEAVARQVSIRVINVQPLTVRQEKFFVVYPLEVVLEGSWKGIARFINLMQTSNVSLSISQMRLEKHTAEGPSLHGRIVFSWIRLRPVEY